MESDTFLTNGFSLFLIQDQKFMIVDVDTLTIQFTFNVEQGYLQGMYYDDESSQITLIAYEYTYPEATDEKVADYYYWRYRNVITKVYIFNVSDPSNTTLARDLAFDNTYLVQSRMIDGMLYLVLDNYQLSYGLDESNFIPTYRDSVLGVRTRQLSASRIFFMPIGNDYISYLMLVSLDTRSDEAADVKAYIGAGWQIFMSLKNLYTTVHQYEYNQETEIYTYYTVIVRFEVQGDRTLAYQATGRVAGSPLNQFSMDEYEGVLRVATTHRVWTQTGSTISNQVYLLDATSTDEMTQISVLGNLGKPGESIFAVRFDGEIGYVVTFVNTDPLYKISLADPSNPYVISAYEEPGVSDYLHLINEDLTLGVGRQATEIGGITRFVGVKVSLYHTGSDTTVLKGNYLVEGDWSYTNVMYDHKAFIYYPRLDLGKVFFAIPVIEYQSSPSNPDYWSYSQSLYVFEIHLETEELIFLGRISHLDNGNNNWNYSWFDSIERAVMIEDQIYTISRNQIRRYSFMEEIALKQSLIIRQVDN